MDPITSVDIAIAQQRKFWRRARATVRQSGHFGERLPTITEAQLELLRERSEAGDPVAEALTPWALAMKQQRRRWTEEEARIQRWSSLQAGEESSPRDLRRAWLGARQSPRRDHAASLFPRVVRKLSMVELDLASKRRDEGESDPLPWVEGHGSDKILSLASQVLSDTDDMARELPEGPWHERLRQAVCVEAAEGWPARLSTSWLESVFAGTRLVDGLRINGIALPALWGASSFARALGRFGIAVLEASRPKHVPLAVHEHPRGTRRHAAHSLFASLIDDRIFAKVILGLGSIRATEHQRLVAQSSVQHLRIEAARTLLWHALHHGPSNRDALHEAFGAVTERTLGTALPTALLAVTPTLDHAAGARLLGTLEAANWRESLIASFDEDWYRNPQAIAEYRDRCSRIRSQDDSPSGGLRLILARLNESLG